MSPPTMTVEDVRKAFDAWWKDRGYSPPTVAARDSMGGTSLDWDGYHLRMGLAWSAFQAGLRLGLGDRKP